MHALLAVLLFLASGESPALPFVEQRVELVSVAHCRDGLEIFCFFDEVQGEFTLLDHRWNDGSQTITRDGGDWLLAWQDDQDGCYRVIRTRCWVESWHEQSPLAEQGNRPWFVGLLEPGLKQPRRQ